MKRVFVALGLTCAIITVGCVITTEHKIEAHIVVELIHIQQQADDVLDFIEGDSESLEGENDGGGSGASAGPTRWLRDVFSPIKTVCAAELKSVSPRMQQIAEKLKKRNPKLVVLKKKDAIGENNKGYVELRNADVLSGAEEADAVRKLLEEENADRQALYKEVVRLNKDSDASQAAVEGIYAQKRLERAEAKDIFQLPEAGEAFDAFKKTEKGRKLGSQCQPGAWVTMK